MATARVATSLLGCTLYTVSCMVVAALAVAMTVPPTTGVRIE